MIGSSTTGTDTSTISVNSGDDQHDQGADQVSTLRSAIENGCREWSAAACIGIERDMISPLRVVSK